MKENVTIKVSQVILDAIKEYYTPFLYENKGEYVLFSAKKDNLVITAYESKKEYYKVTFIGENALKEAINWDENAVVNLVKAPIKSQWLCLENQIGSDEVGVGDFLLPMIVVAAFVTKQDMKILKEYGVDDSKKLKDSEILKIGEALSSKFFISKLTLPNEKYNNLLKTENLNSMKAKMHNRALLNLYKRFPDTKHIFIDQFCSKENYFAYLNDAKEMQIRNLYFKEKGESYYPSIALASVMARYAFLKEKQLLEDKYQMEFPLGAGKKVDEFAQQFISKHGVVEFKKIAKQNFANYKKLNLN